VSNRSSETKVQCIYRSGCPHGRCTTHCLGAGTLEAASSKKDLTFQEAYERAQKAAIAWDPLTHNRKDSFLREIRNAYAYGYTAALLAEGAHETTSPQAPIAKLYINGGVANGVVVYAPGLPDGEHELYCEPASVAPAVKATPHRLDQFGDCRNPGCTYPSIGNWDASKCTAVKTSCSDAGNKP